MSALNTNSWSAWVADQASIVVNIASSMASVQKLVTGAAYLMGLIFAFKSIYALKIYGESRTMMSGNTNLKEPVLYMIVAVMLIYFPTGMAIVLNTTFGSSSILQYASTSTTNSALGVLFGSGSLMGPPLAVIIQTIGVIAFVRGWVLIARSASQGGGQPGTTGKGLTHVFGGILAMNIVATLEIVNNTLYGT